MHNIFYQANFCAECGNPLEPRKNWRPRYLCDYCAGRIGRRSNFMPLSLLIVFIVISFAFDERQQSTNSSGAINRSNIIDSSSIISAQDASPRQKTISLAEKQERVICGARTKKGAPCRRRVRPGQRCPQHRGMPSLLKSEQGRDMRP